MGNQPSERISLVGPPRQNFFDQGQHSVLIKMTIAQISVLPAFHHQLSPLARPFSIDSCLSQAAVMVFHGARIDDVKRLLPTFDSFANKREEYAVLFIRGMKKRTNMTVVSECRVSKMNRLLATAHQFSPMVICVCKRDFLAPPYGKRRSRAESAAYFSSANL